MRQDLSSTFLANKKMAVRVPIPAILSLKRCGGQICGLLGRPPVRHHTNVFRNSPCVDITAVAVLTVARQSLVSFATISFSKRFMAISSQRIATS